MTATIEFLTALFCQVDDQLSGFPTHPEAHLWPSEVVTLGLLQALKGGGNRPFSRWLTRDSRPLFPRVPERTRLLRLITTPQDWTSDLFITLDKDPVTRLQNTSFPPANSQMNY